MRDYKKILEDNKDNTGLLGALVGEVNSYDGSLEYLEAYEFDDEFFEMAFNGKPMEAARALFFGSVDNWSDEYIRFDGYGNLESLSEYQREQELEDNADDIITEALRLADDGNIDLDWVIDGHVHNLEEDK